MIVFKAMGFCRNSENSIAMKHKIVESLHGVTLAGGGPFGAALLARALALAPVIVGADGGADRLLRLGAEPTAVIGDFDSISATARARLAGRLFPIAEQETTDFDKALRSIAAPFVLGLGFAGARLDHGLAVLNALVRQADQRCLLLSPQDVTFVAPPEMRLDLPLGSRFSLFPMGAVNGGKRGAALADPRYRICARWHDWHLEPSGGAGASAGLCAAHVGDLAA